MLGMILGLFFIIISLPFLLWFLFIINYVKNVENKYFKTKGSIEELRLLSNRKCNGLPGYHYKIYYVFDPVGKKDIGIHGVECSRFRYLNKKSAQKVLSNYRVDQEIDVHYASDMPETSTICPGFRKDMLYPLALFIIFFTVGLILLINH